MKLKHVPYGEKFRLWKDGPVYTLLAHHNFRVVEDQLGPGALALRGSHTVVWIPLEETVVPAISSTVDLTPKVKPVPTA